MTDKEQIEKGDIFYSVMQKDNCPFEKPRIVKFVVDKILNENATHPIVATKTDKWGRHYCFKKSQIYLTYQDAIPEKNEKIKKIKQWEKHCEEMDKKYFEEQQKREELERNAKAVEALQKLKKHLLSKGSLLNMCAKMEVELGVSQLIKEYGGNDDRP